MFRIQKERAVFLASPSYAWKASKVCCLPQTSNSTPGQSMVLEGKMGRRLRYKISISSETESSTEEGAGLPCTPPLHHSTVPETTGTQSFVDALGSESGGRGFAERPFLSRFP